LNPSEKSSFLEVVTEIHGYYRQGVSEFTLDLWWATCKAYELGDVKRAIARHVQDPERGNFPITIADVSRHLVGKVGERAQRAWGQVLDAAARVGAYSDVVFEDPATMAAIEDQGGWPRLCRMPTADLGYIQTAFVKAYQAYAQSGKFNFPRVLHGDRSPDAEYEKRQLPLPKPVLVGDPARCLQVLEHGASGGKTLITQGAAPARCWRPRNDDLAYP
jgi:hypothetical protein